MNSIVLSAAHGISAARSVLEGDALDSLANAIAWLALIVVPIVGIAVFWLLHILPEKIAEKKEHPQTSAIQTLCLLSLFFGGLLWPLAWLWAYSKPVFYKAAYGVDKVPHGHEPEAAASAAVPDELRRLRERLNDLSNKSPENSDLRQAIADVNALESQLGSGGGSH